MPIEFHCTQCQHRLRTPDDSAGKQSRCPQCGHIQTIPPANHFGAADPEPKPLPARNPFDSTQSGHAQSAADWLPADNPFAAAPGPAAANPYAAPRAMSDPSLNRRAPILPGALLIGISATSGIFLSLAIFAGIVTVIDEGVEQDDVLAFIFLGATLVSQIFILWGGVNMVRRRGYAMAIAGAFAAVVPLSLCWCLHLPIGAWALYVLSKQGMRSVFSGHDR